MKKVILILALAISPIFFCQTTDAQQCNNVPVQIQSSQYVPHQVRQTQQILNVQQVAQVLILGIPVETLNLPFYWSVGYDINEQKIIQGVYDKIQKENKTPSAAPKVASKTPIELFKLLPQKIELNPQDLTLQAQSIFKKYNCITCHKAGQSSPAIKLFNDDGSFPVYSDKESQRIMDALDEGRMPKGGSPLNDTEKDVIENFLNRRG